MTSEQSWQRSDIIGTQIITRDNGKRLGVVSQLWIDVDQREVVAIGMRENILSGVLSNIQQTMLLSSVRQVGDVILVDTDTVVEDSFNTELYSSLINSEVITETGDMLGKVRGFRFSPLSGKVETIIIASFGLPQIPDQLISTYELSMDEVVSSGPDRLIVFEGAEEKLNQLSVGLLERIGIGKSPGEKDDMNAYPKPMSTQNQLPSGARVPVEPLKTRTPIAAQETWDDDNWNEPQRQREPLRQQAPLPYDEEPAANWGDDDDLEEYEDVDYQIISDAPVANAANPVLEESPPLELDTDTEKDLWEDDENPKPYRAPKVEIPERKRVVEYEEETDY
ncbi:MAG: PRC-barrel domain-containing protein [Timaviella obliquedivisa GSE-PSE-MK23-08B]|jgi:sporulation protein YlmC with PRC-barrel domain|nr:PRC-barrel domain-containing protein [Timaviella obliquedivisa GSE-PSE-MK23-08B]